MPGADLVIDSFSALGTNFAAGTQIRLEGVIRNAGTDVASLFEYGIYLSTDPVITPGVDTLLGGDIIWTLYAGDTYSDSGFVQLPTGLAPGTYYVGLYADDAYDVTETNEGNNAAAVAINIVSGGLPDLSVTSISTTATDYLPGDSVNLAATVTNTGNVTATGYDLGIYLSTDAVIDPATDTYLGGFTAQTLPDNGTINYSGNVFLPSNLAAGTYYIGAYVDTGNGIAESNEANNASPAPMAITVAAPNYAVVVSGTFPTGNTIVDAVINDGDHWSGPGTGPAVLTVFLSGQYRAWNSLETAAITAAMASWEAVANIDFQLVSSQGAANFVEYVVPASVEPNLGSHELPTVNAGDVVQGWFNYEGLGWDETDPNGGLNVGGYGYVTLVHELGHGLGLDHPHDGTVVLPGVTNASDLGSNQLNQGIYTVMSYNDGWQSQQNPVGNGLVAYGYVGGPSAIDIAAVQALYGANTSYRTGNDTYVLPAANGVGTYWLTIWDAGGVDEIVHQGTQGATIDLRPATLADEPGGGGFPSWATGIYGGYTIANGVVIENASGGSGDDTITGNDVANVLKGNYGADTLRGNGGNDTLHGGGRPDVLWGDAGSDTLYGDNGNDELHGGPQPDVLWGGNDSDTLYGDNGNDELHGGPQSDVLWGGNDSDTLYGDNGNDELHGGPHNDILWGGNDNDRLYGEGGEDRLYGERGADTLYGGGQADILDGGPGNDVLWGGYGSDTINGGVNDDTIYGEGQPDTIDGGPGRDLIRAGNGNDLVRGGDQPDTIYGGNDSDTLYGDNGNDVIYGEAQPDTLYGGNNDDRLYGGNGNDVLYGEAQSDHLYGELNDDRLYGGPGNDWLYGGGNSDLLDGGLNNDFLDGGLGDDTLTGGSEADTFYYGKLYGADVITDFQNNVDKIDLSAFGFASVSDAMALASQVNADVVFSFGGGHTLTVKNVQLAWLPNDIII